MVTIDLKSPDLLPSTKHFQNVKKSLQHPLLSNISFHFTWIASSPEVCPSSIAKYFSDKSYNIKLCQNELNSHQEYFSKLPEIPDNLQEDTLEEIVEFIGMVTLGCDLEPKEELSSYVSPDGIEMGSARILNIQGFIPCESLLKLVMEAK